jgi:hypothetical protein
MAARTRRSAIDAINGRMGIDSLAQLWEKLVADPFSGGLFIFRRKRSKRSLEVEMKGEIVHAPLPTGKFFLMHETMSADRRPGYS